jgi:hypothetical protein
MRWSTCFGIFVVVNSSFMTEDEKDLARIGADAAMKPIANLLEKLFGGSAEEIGAMWQDFFKVRRLQRQSKLLKRVNDLIAEEGFEPERVNDRVGIRLLGAALLEDDETLQEKWAALLMKAANPRTADSITPTFVSILSELTPRQAFFLDLLNRPDVPQGQPKHTLRFPAPRPFYSEGDLTAIYAQAGLAFQVSPTAAFIDASFYETVDVLRRLGLLTTRPTSAFSEKILYSSATVNTSEIYEVTALGIAFIIACRTPAKPDASE